MKNMTISMNLLTNNDLTLPTAYYRDVNYTLLEKISNQLILFSFGICEKMIR